MKKKKFEILLVLVAFLTYTYFAFVLPVSMAPDEAMRIDVVNFMNKYNVLPIGTEKELIHPVWGFSYALFPYLPSIIGVVAFKVIHIFTTNEQLLLVGIRFASILSGTGIVFMCLKIGKLVFKKNSAAYLLAVLCGFLPQVVFLSSYLNNDIFAVFTSSLIIYFWIKGVKTNWEYKSCIYLGISLGLCLLSYYNAYAFVLCSVFVYVSSFFYLNKKKWKVFIGKGCLIFCSAFIIAGWYFIRAYLLYDGDILGFEIVKKTAELYGASGYKPSERISVSEMMPLSSMLFGDHHGLFWVKASIKSYIGTFGYMSIWLTSTMYRMYVLYIAVGLGSAIAYLMVGIRKIKTIEWIFIINLTLCILIPIGLSIYYSYYNDYQSQGRYFISSLIPVMLLGTYGFDRISSSLSRIIRYNKIQVNHIVAILYLIMFLHVYTTYMLPLGK